MQIGSQSFLHIMPGNNNAEMVGQPGHAITDHECPPAVWVLASLCRNIFRLVLPNYNQAVPQCAWEYTLG